MTTSTLLTPDEAFTRLRISPALRCVEATRRALGDHTKEGTR